MSKNEPDYTLPYEPYFARSDLQHVTVQTIPSQYINRESRSIQPFASDYRYGNSYANNINNDSDRLAESFSDVTINTIDLRAYHESLYRDPPHVNNSKLIREQRHVASSTEYLLSEDPYGEVNSH